MTDPVDDEITSNHSPTYSIRVSQRAKRARIEVSPFGRVEVVVPKRFNPKHVPGFVASHRDWLLRTLQRLTERRSLDPALYAIRPTSVDLPAINASWQVVYDAKQRTPIAANMGQGHTGSLYVRDGTETQTRVLLRNWLHGEAKSRLPPWIHEVSEELRLPFTKLVIRGQKTRWGSCSSRGTLSINRNLLFLPPHLVRYLFIHELCHTVYLNHSNRYWCLVKKFEPHYQRHEKALQQAAYRIPLWAQPE